MFQDNQQSYNKPIFPFQEHIKGRFAKWTGIMDDRIEDALVDLSGDTYFEMRKLIKVILTETERMIVGGKYAGFQNGKELTEEQKQSINVTKEDFKDFLRTNIEQTWKTILNKQKVGVDKLGLALSDYLPGENGNDNANN